MKKLQLIQIFGNTPPDKNKKPIKKNHKLEKKMKALMIENPDLGLPSEDDNEKPSSNSIQAIFTNMDYRIKSMISKEKVLSYKMDDRTFTITLTKGYTLKVTKTKVGPKNEKGFRTDFHRYILTKRRTRRPILDVEILAERSKPKEKEEIK